MKRIWRSALIVFLVLLSFLVVGIDRNVTSGEYTVRSGETIHGGMFISSPGVVTIEEGARVDGSVFMGSGVLNLNGEITGGLLSISGEVHTGPTAVVNGHATVTSVPFDPNLSTQINNNITADVAGWMGGPLGAAVVLLALTIYLVYGPVIGRLVLHRTQARDVTESEAAYRRAADYTGVALVAATGALYLSGVLGVEIDQIVFSLALLVPGLALFGVMFIRGPKDSPIALAASAFCLAGAIELYQGITGNWQSWAFAWALVVPMSIGLGQMIEGWWGRADQRVTEGARLSAVGAVLFAVSWIFFELIVPATGNGLLNLGVLLLIVAGAVLFTMRTHRPGGRLTAA